MFNFYYLCFYLFIYYFHWDIQKQQKYVVLSIKPHNNQVSESLSNMAAAEMHLIVEDSCHYQLLTMSGLLFLV